MNEPMEKRNVIEEGRTPDMPKQADADGSEQSAVKMFGRAIGKSTAVLCGDCVCRRCPDRATKEVTDVA